MQSNNWGNTQQRWIASGFPFTIALMVLTLVTALLAVLAPSIYQSAMFLAPFSLLQPWTLLTYSVLGTPSIFIIFDIGLLYWFGSSLERSWGTKAFVLFWVFISVFSALSLSLGATLLRIPNVPALPILPMAAMAFVWAFLNSEERMSFFFLPLRGIHFAPIALIYIVFSYGRMGLTILPFAMLGCLAAFAWLKWGISYRIQNSGDGLLPMSRPVRRTGGRPNLRLVPEKPLDDRFTLSKLNPLRALKSRKDRRKFEKLMGGDD